MSSLLVPWRHYIPISACVQAGEIRRVVSDDDSDPCQRLRKCVSRRRHARRQEAGPIGRTDAETFSAQRADVVRRRVLAVLTTGQSIEYQISVVHGAEER